MKILSLCIALFVGLGSSHDHSDAPSLREKAHDTPCENFEVATIQAGLEHTCVLSMHGAVKCWGNNMGGQLGYGTAEVRGYKPHQMGDHLPFVDLGSDFAVQDLVVGNAHTCVLSTRQKIKCWGVNIAGALGYGDEKSRGKKPDQMGDYLPLVDLGLHFPVQAIALGDAHTCALSTRGEVKCWGINKYGQLGYGDTKARGNRTDTMGDYLPVVDLGHDFPVQKIVLGTAHICALSTHGEIKCWGSNSGGQLGYGDTKTRGNNNGTMGEYLPVVDLGHDFPVKDLTLGDDYTCALSTRGAVKCWGRNAYGQLGYGDDKPRGHTPDQMGDHLPPLDLGKGFVVQAIALSHYHACALSTHGAVKCWGYNDYGQLGYGDTKMRGRKAGQMGDQLPVVDLGSDFVVQALAVGSHHTCALSTHGAVKCWGYNDYGQLGYGDEKVRGNQLDQMGDHLPVVDLGEHQDIDTCRLHSAKTHGILASLATTCFVLYACYRRRMFAKHHCTNPSEGDTYTLDIEKPKLSALLDGIAQKLDSVFAPPWSTLSWLPPPKACDTAHIEQFCIALDQFFAPIIDPKDTYASALTQGITELTKYGEREWLLEERLNIYLACMLVPYTVFFWYFKPHWNYLYIVDFDRFSTIRCIITTLFQGAKIKGLCGLVSLPFMKIAPRLDLEALPAQLETVVFLAEYRIAKGASAPRPIGTLALLCDACILYRWINPRQDSSFKKSVQLLYTPRKKVLHKARNVLKAWEAQYTCLQDEHHYPPALAHIVMTFLMGETLCRASFVGMDIPADFDLPLTQARPPAAQQTVRQLTRQRLGLLLCVVPFVVSYASFSFQTVYGWLTH